MTDRSSGFGAPANWRSGAISRVSGGDPFDRDESLAAVLLRASVRWPG